jgi:hypothetical protein
VACVEQFAVGDQVGGCGAARKVFGRSLPSHRLDSHCPNQTASVQIIWPLGEPSSARAGGTRPGSWGLGVINPSGLLGGEE